MLIMPQLGQRVRDPLQIIRSVITRMKKSLSAETGNYHMPSQQHFAKNVVFSRVLERSEWYQEINCDDTTLSSILSQAYDFRVPLHEYHLGREEFLFWTRHFGYLVPCPEISKLAPDIAAIAESLRTEKLLEYFLSDTLGQIRPGFKVADIGSADSAFVRLVRERGAEVWAVDPVLKSFSQPQDVLTHYLGMTISHAARILPALDVMTLHCSFEMFDPKEMEAVIACAEANLRPGGRLLILPLYLNPNRTIYVDTDIHLEINLSGDKVHPCIVGVNNYWGIRWSEWMSIGDLVSRLVMQFPRLEFNLLHITNPHDIDRGCFIRFVGVWEKI